jgi:hypothetical protein
LIDVVPAHGENIEEAKEIALTGRAFELSKKFDTDIGNWTYEDTQELTSLMSWRARFFFPIRQRLGRTVRELQRIHDETGKQPRDLGLAKVVEIRENLQGGKVSWFEKAIVNGQSFNSIFGLAIISVVIAYNAP